MKRFLVALVFLLGCAFGAQKVEITADEIFADERVQVSTLTGNVVVNKGSFDRLNADKVVINVDASRQPLKYTATGDVKFQILLSGKHYNGSCGKLIYEPQKQLYTFEERVVLREIETNRVVNAQKITADQAKGVYQAHNKKAPVRLIFEVQN